MSEKSGSPRVRELLGAVLVVQSVFAMTAGAIVILDPEGILDEPRDRLLAGLLLLAPMAMALVLALRFRSGHRAERRSATATAQLMDTVLTPGQEWVWAVDDQGRFTFSSPTSETILGWKPDELLGQHCGLIIDGGDLARAKIDVAAAAGPEWTGVIVRCRHRDGRSVWLNVSGTVRAATNDRAGGFEGTSRMLPPLTAREAIDSLHREQIQNMLDQDRLLTAFQPIHSLTTGKLLGVEALARFVDEGGAGTEFWFKEAAIVGLLGELEFAAMDKALAAARGLPPDIYVALNLSPETCLDPRLPDLLQRSGLPPKRIVLELTERLEVNEYDPLLAVLAPLRQEGLRVAVDDAGSGFASMRHVLHIRPDIIKLDRSLIAGIDDDQGQHALGAAMVEFARQIGASLTAEGIETPEELAAVAGLGMSAGQGYLIGRPSIEPTDWSAWSESARARPGTP